MKIILFIVFKLWKSDIWKISHEDNKMYNIKKFQFIFCIYISIYA